METTWLYACALVIGLAVHSSAPGFAAMLALFVGGAWSGRLARLLPVRYPFNFGVLLPASLVALALWAGAALSPDHRLPLGRSLPSSALPGFWVAGALPLYLWGRGVWIGLRPPTTETLGRWLLVGAGAFLILFALAAADRERTVAAVSDRLEILVLGYFIVGLSVIALVHAQTLHRRAATRQPITLSWLVALAAPMIAIVGLGLLLAADVAPLLNVALHVLVDGALLLWRALLWLGAWIVWLFAWLSHLFPSAPPDQSHPDAAPAHHPSPSMRYPEWHLAIAANPMPAYVLLGLLAVALGLLFLRLLLRRPSLDQPDGVAEQRDSLWSWRLFGEQLRALWDALRGRVARPRDALGGWAADVFASRPLAPEALDIRLIYRRLLRWAGDRGLHRRPGTTPQELLRAMVIARPELQAPLTLITRRYEEARYGGAEIAGEALAESAAAEARIAGSAAAEVGSNR
jgi:hypothetical protein